jgi:arginine decarboxylase
LTDAQTTATPTTASPQAPPDKRSAPRPQPHHDQPAPDPWTIERAAETFGVDAWGAGYVGIAPSGALQVHPTREPDRAIDLLELVEGLRERNIETPVLLRFSDIVGDRLRQLRAAFDAAIADEQYQGRYACVYPIKVNQQRNVVQEIIDHGSPLGFGLEAGSKPELLAVLGLTVDHPHMPIVCNGFKDREFAETVVLATKLGRTIYTVIEKFSELTEIVELSEKYGVAVRLGVRVKLSAEGVGRWEESGGARSKFGLTVPEILRALDYLKQRNMADRLQLLHCHVGSQVCDIRNVKNAITELAHVYAELHRLGAGMTTIDIGGGLAVDYDGTASATDSSANYGLPEYAADVVYRIKAVCDAAPNRDADGPDATGIPHPNIISESGRAMISHASVLVFEAIGSARYDAGQAPDELDAALAAAQRADADEDIPQPVVDLFDAYRHAEERQANLSEVYHDAEQARAAAMQLFSLGYLSLPMRAVAERAYWATCLRVMQRVRTLIAAGETDLPPELERLPQLLSDHVFCNLSIFQSMPDSWAIDQLFPICPIHRLDEQPTRHAVLADITCDSDGKIDRFVDPWREHAQGKRTLELHEIREGERYFLAAFLVGAYQEILGDLHNLFGDTHAVHVALDESGEFRIDEIIPGDTVTEVLSYVQIDDKELRRAMRRDTERAVRSRVMSPGEAGALMRFFEHGLDGYTYLEH